MTAATFPRPFVPIAELPGADLEPGPLETPEFVAKQVAVLDARRRQGMNLIVLNDDGRIVKIAPDGTKTDVTAEADRRVARARKRLGWDA
ncbi:MAG: hypothetical protein WBA25_07600 [Jannaschia sp.]